MKRTKTLFLALVAVIVGLLAATPGWTGYGRGGPGDGTCHLTTIPECTAVEISGTVYAATSRGDGLLVDTGGGEIVTVYGLGPVWFWERAEVERPAVGESVTMTAYEVTYSNGATRLIAIDITMQDADGTEVVMELRDPATGAPLWRMPRFGNRGGHRS
jgi:hypothetical protein